MFRKLMGPVMLLALTLPTATPISRLPLTPPAALCLIQEPPLHLPVAHCIHHPSTSGRAPKRDQWARVCLVYPFAPTPLDHRPIKVSHNSPASVLRKNDACWVESCELHASHIAVQVCVNQTEVAQAPWKMCWAMTMSRKLHLVTLQPFGLSICLWQDIEIERLFPEEVVIKEAIKLAEQDGIVFIDEVRAVRCSTAVALAIDQACGQCTVPSAGVQPRYCPSWETRGSVCSAS